MSVTELPDAGQAPSGTTIERLLLVWQDPQTRSFAPVGVLSREPDQSFVFRYVRRAEREPTFRPLESFPDLRGTYRFAELPPFFHNRVMSPRRPDFPAYVRALDLSTEWAPPFEILARTGGSRATDTFHVVAEPRVDADGQVRTLFLANGIRHIPGAADRIARLSPGDPLALLPAPENEHNARALLLDAGAGQAVGYVPDWMLDTVRRFVQADPAHRLTVEVANGPDTPPHLRLLCRLEARITDSGVQPRDPDLEPIG